MNTFTHRMLGAVVRDERTNITTFPDIVDELEQPYRVFGTLAYSLAAALEHVTVPGPRVHAANPRPTWATDPVACMCDFEGNSRHGCRHEL